MLYFGQFKGHNARDKKGNYTNDPIFSSTFWGKTVCDTRFRIWNFSVKLRSWEPNLSDLMVYHEIRQILDKIFKVT